MVTIIEQAFNPRTRKFRKMWVTKNSYGKVINKSRTYANAVKWIRIKNKGFA